MHQRIQADPVIGTDPQFLSFGRSVHEFRLAFQVGAIFYAVEILLSLFVDALLKVSPNIIVLLISTVMTYNLWIGKKSWRGYAIFYAIVRLFIGFYLFTAQIPLTTKYIIAIEVISFSASVILVLTGWSNRIRTMIASAIYVIGYIGMNVLLIVLRITG
jgi:hypothetical protein